MAATAATITTRRATRAERAAYARRATAYHEAGHAAAALVVGRRFRYVTIEPDPDDESLGHCQFTHRWPRGLDPATASPERLERLERLEPFLRKEMLIALAGGAAEAQFRGRRNYVGAVGDYASAKTYARWATGCHGESDEWDDWCERCEWSKKSDCDTYLDRL
jgi:ATP-dependent Zn protease